MQAIVIGVLKCCHSSNHQKMLMNSVEDSVHEIKLVFPVFFLLGGS